MARLKREALRLLGSGADVPGDRAGLDTRFDRALAEMHMVFQPIVDLSDGKVFGYEALMRSSEPSLPSPVDIVHAAERLERVYDMGMRVRELAIQQFAELADSEVLLFLNLHTSELLDATLYASSSPLHPFAHRIVLEVTERGAIDKIVDVRDRVGVLRFHGFRLAIDDLGAGYAGLTSFVTLEPEIIKLDMSLIREIETSPLRQELVRSIVEISHQFHMRVVAEGVETIGELNAARAAGCDFAQGYLLGRPSRKFGPLVRLPT